MRTSALRKRITRSCSLARPDAAQQHSLHRHTWHPRRGRHGLSGRRRSMRMRRRRCRQAGPRRASRRTQNLPSLDRLAGLLMGGFCAFQHPTVRSANRLGLLRVAHQLGSGWFRTRRIIPLSASMRSLRKLAVTRASFRTVSSHALSRVPCTVLQRCVRRRTGNHTDVVLAAFLTVFLLAIVAGLVYVLRQLLKPREPAEPHYDRFDALLLLVLNGGRPWARRRDDTDDSEPPIV